MEIKIGNRNIGRNNQPFIVAEMSGNHNRSLARALAIVDAAAKSGVHALKLQTYTADTMTIDVKKKGFFIKDRKSLWKGKALYQLYEEAHTPWEWHKKIFDRCRRRGIIGFSTPFDETAVDFLESLDVPCFKIASFELVDIPLIEKVASTGKPILMSTGMATVKEINEAVKVARKVGSKDIVLLKCTSTYPASPENTNILTIPDIEKRFKCQVGISDHTLGIGAAIASVALGATVIEKHFTLSRKEGSVDAAFSMEPEEMTRLVTEIERSWQALGRVTYGPSQAEKKSLVFRRSLYIVRDSKKGDIVSKENVRAIRPGLGMSPKYLSGIIGKRFTRNYTRGTPLKPGMVH